MATHSQQRRGAILGRREKISEKFVILCCVVVGCFLLIVCCVHLSFGLNLFAFTYFFFFWVMPAISYMQGLETRRAKKLLWWCASVFIHVFLMLVTCVAILYNHTTSPYLTFDNSCILAVTLLGLTPAWVACLLLPTLVYLSVDDKGVMEIMEIHQVESRPVQRISRHPIAPHQPPQIQSSHMESNTSTTLIPDSINPSSLVSLARSQYTIVLDGSTSLLSSMWGTFNTDRQTGTQEMIEHQGVPDMEIINNPAEDDNEEVDPPSYNVVEDTDLPSYEDLGVKNLRIGTKVIVVDKDFHVSTFTNN